jgi:hypothetical protein
MLGARWYDPELGRFISADSIVPNPGNPQALNRYSYTLNDPLKYTDPSGHAPASCYGKPDCNVKELNTAEWALYMYCGHAQCYGENVGYLSINLKFATNLAGEDLGTISLPYHVDVANLGPNERFEWEGVANVVYNEDRQLHPAYNKADLQAEAWFTQHWLGDAAGIVQTTIARAARYGSPNAAAMEPGQYAPPHRDLTDPAYKEFYAVTFMVIEMNVRVDQPYEYFAHQDINEIRGHDPTNRNAACCTESVGFGPTFGRKDHYITTLYPAVYGPAPR